MEGLKLRVASVLSIGGLMALCTVPSLPSASECLGWLLQQADPLLVFVGARDGEPAGDMLLMRHRSHSRRGSSIGRDAARKAWPSKSRSRSAGRHRRRRSSAKHNSVPRRQFQSAEAGPREKSSRRRHITSKKRLRGERERRNRWNTLILQGPGDRPESAAERPVGFLAPLETPSATKATEQGPQWMTMRLAIPEPEGGAPAIPQSPEEEKLCAHFEKSLNKVKDGLELEFSAEDRKQFVTCVQSAIKSLTENNVPDASAHFVKGFNHISRAGPDTTKQGPDMTKQGQGNFLRWFAGLSVIGEAIRGSDLVICEGEDDKMQKMLTTADESLKDAPPILSTAVVKLRNSGFCTGFYRNSLELPKLDQDVNTSLRLIRWVNYQVNEAVEFKRPGHGVMPLAHFLQESERSAKDSQVACPEFSLRPVMPPVAR